MPNDLADGIPNLATETEKLTYARVTSRLLGRLLPSPLVALGAHWLFQSLHYMDGGERLFKIALDIAFTLPGTILLATWMPAKVAFPAALLTAHTLNFLFNGHLWGVLKHYGGSSNSYGEYAAYACRFLNRASRHDAIHFTVLCGSLPRQEWSPASDLDVRLIRRPGIKNWLLVACFLLRERTVALFARFPLDAYMLDDEASLPRFVADEPLIIFDSCPN